VIQSAGISAPSLSGDWEGYLSLDPAMVAARARQSLDSVQSLIESERIFFDPGSAVLSGSAIARLSRAIGLVRQLDQIATSLNATVRLSLTGRTDVSGRDETNAALAQQRVESVAAFLESAGVDRSRLVPVPVATNAPLESSDAVERARINRSVSFNVGLSAASSPRGGDR
jgi:OOP family OmpA-OmpF porin